MKRSLFAAAALLLAVTGAEAAKPTTLSRSGAWETYITRNSDSKPMCGMKVLGHGSVLTVKYSGGEIFLQIYKVGWQIPENTDIPGWLQFDNSQRYPMIGTGFMHTTGMGFVEFTVKDGSEMSFLNLFGDADKMILGFDQGTQVPFTVNMNGSRAAATMFARCAKMIDTPEPQPFAKPTPPAPQPFGNGSTQPVKKPGGKRDDGSI